MSSYIITEEGEERTVCVYASVFVFLYCLIYFSLFKDDIERERKKRKDNRKEKGGHSSNCIVNECVSTM